MKVKIEYFDNSALAAEEIVASAKNRYGDSASVTVLPDFTDAFSLIYFAVQNLITDKQLEAYFHENQLYKEKCRELLDTVLDLATEVTYKVLRDNERRLE